MLSSATMWIVRSSGTLMCLASGAGFGAMAVFGKLSYEEGVTVGTLLTVRFALAAALFWLLLVARGGLRDVRAMTRRDVGFALALGACGYALQAGGFFAALDRMDASLLALILYTYPAMVAAVAVALGRERLDGRKVAALLLASTGLVLVLAGAGAGEIDPLGAALGLGAAITYTTYILVGQRVVARVRPRVLSTIVCTGAAASLLVGTTLLGEFRPGEVTAEGWGWLMCLAVVSTVVAVSLFFAGLERVGPTAASILSTIEPVVTVALAFLVFGEVLGTVQLAGGALVLAAVFVLNARADGHARAREEAIGSAPA